MRPSLYKNVGIPRIKKTDILQKLSLLMPPNRRIFWTLLDENDSSPDFSLESLHTFSCDNKL
jgi:hypothetical protein